MIDAYGEVQLNEIRAKGYAALARELGPVGYVRFIQQFHAGKGDYTKERAKVLEDVTVDHIRQLIVRQRES